MCNNYTLKSRLSAIERAARDQLRLPLVLPAGHDDATSNLTWREGMWPTYQGLALRPVDPDAPADGLEPFIGRWGLVAATEKRPLKALKPCNNARMEGLRETWPFRFSLRNRCLIPLDSFTEWTGPEGSKTPHAISNAAGALLFAAGLWQQNDRHPEGPLTSFTMVMQPVLAADEMAPFHDRQPVFLDAARAQIWLTPAEDYAPIMTAMPRSYLAFDPPEPAPA